jgi:hypothetical protein
VKSHIIALRLAGTPEGVIHGFGSFFTITDSNFTTNSGRQTGAITIEDGSLTTSGCIFNSNQGAQVGSCKRLFMQCALRLSRPLACWHSRCQL